jgi:glycosyltransferase involved in cell wall biosynthesis
MADHLRRERPAVLFAPSRNVIFGATLARRLAGTDTPIVASLRTHTSSEVAITRNPRRNAGFQQAFARALAAADRVHAVSRSVAQDVEQAFGVPPGRVRVVHNPTLRRDIDRLAAEPVDHPWLRTRDRPVLLAVGRISPQKDYPTLVAAFAAARRQRSMRLLIIGEVTFAEEVPGKRAGKLRRQLDELGCAEDVALLGPRANPFAWMARCDLFVHSSRFEGLPNVLIEALACGCAIVATDAPGGTSEVLDGGRHGTLVPVGDEATFARSILAALDRPRDPEGQKARARAYAPGTAVTGYLDLLTEAARVP